MRLLKRSAALSFSLLALLPSNAIAERRTEQFAETEVGVVDAKAVAATATQFFDGEGEITNVLSSRAKWFLELGYLTFFAVDPKQEGDSSRCNEMEPEVSSDCKILTEKVAANKQAILDLPTPPLLYGKLKVIAKGGTPTPDPTPAPVPTPPTTASLPTPTPTLTPETASNFVFNEFYCSPLRPGELTLFLLGVDTPLISEGSLDSEPSDSFGSENSADSGPDNRPEWLEVLNLGAGGSDLSSIPGVFYDVTNDDRVFQVSAGKEWAELGGGVSLVDSFQLQVNKENSTSFSMEYGFGVRFKLFQTHITCTFNFVTMEQ